MRKIRKHVKAALCLLLCFAMLSCTAFAFTQNKPNDKATSSHNSCIPTKSYVYQTQFADIKQTVDGYYALETIVSADKVDVPVGRLDIDLSVPEQYLLALKRDDISEPVKDRLKELHQRVLDGTMTSTTVSLFSPTLLDLTQRAVPEQAYYTWQGHSMMNERLYSNTDPAKPISTKWITIVEGVDTKRIAQGLTNIVITGLGTRPGYIGITATGVSLLQSFIDKFGTKFVSGEKSDYVQMRITYENIDQWTWTNIDGDWYLGLKSNKACVHRVQSLTYFYTPGVGGETNPEDNYPSTKEGIHESPHFDASKRDEAAWKNRYSTLNETVGWQVGDNYLVF